MKQDTTASPTTGPGTGIRFSNKEHTDFYATLKRRIDQYFKDTNQSKKANGAMIRKTLFILAVYVLTYLLILSNLFSPAALLALAVVHGFFTALIGLNITHDAMHGAYSSKPKVNYRIGLLFNLLGANDYMWKLSHNLLHHSFTNIAEHDADVDQLPLLRLNTKQSLWWVHRFQYIYVFFFYALTTLAWVFVRDYPNPKPQTPNPKPQTPLRKQ